MTAASTFVPPGLDTTRFENIEPLARALLDRPVNSAKELEAWLIDRSELDAACSEGRANLYIDMTCDTEDKVAQARYLAYIEEVQPRLTPLGFELDRRQVDLSKRYPLDAARYGVLERATRADVELFRPENVPLETELAKLGQQYDQVVGAMSVTFDGREQTLPQMARYQEVTDRAVRESAWRAVAARRAADAETISGIYDRMISLRDRVGRNAGFDNFIGYAFKSKHRFDYGVAECEAFHDAVERAVVPLCRSLDRERARALGADPLRPWDLAVDVKGRPPLRPFKDGRELMAKSLAAMKRLDPRLASMLAELGDGSNASGARGGACLDLDSRRGKAPGGYQYMRDRSRRAFIFMNAAGMHKDVQTMVHEAGHAFHSRLCVGEPLLAYRHSPVEFAEVASMSMELLSAPHLGGEGGFYPSPDDHRRALRDQFLRSVQILPWIATIDALQLWIYANPGHSRDQRAAKWLELDRRFGSAVSWDGLEPVRRVLWQRQLHLFGHPLYYIEYGIAQLGALQLWLRSVQEGERAAVDSYLAALSLGGSRPLPELFRAAGLTFDFGYDMVARITDRVASALRDLPE